MKTGLVSNLKQLQEKENDTRIFKMCAPKCFRGYADSVFFTFILQPVVFIKTNLILQPRCMLEFAFSAI